VTQIFNVAVIGAGLLGRRHLQSLDLCEKNIKISVVDTAVVSLEFAKNDLSNTKAAQNVEYYHSIEDVTDNIDLAIVATTAKVRLSVLKALLIKKVKNIILEKVAFNSLSEIELAQKIVKGSNVNIWVNCPRRLYPIYQELKVILKKYTAINYSIKGSDYGLACNGIHYIDFFSYLENCDDYAFKRSNITEMTESKRDGYIECFGDLIGEFSSGCGFQLECKNNGVKPEYKIIIELDEGSIEIDEIRGCMSIDIGGEIETRTFTMPYQSELTGPLVDTVIDTSQCELTGFYESMKIHVPFVREAYNEYAKIYGSNEKMFVPIT
jgi:predicted dehydrogenase